MKYTLSSPVQPENALFPMLVTLFGMVTDTTSVRPSKAELLMVVPLPEIVSAPVAVSKIQVRLSPQVPEVICSSSHCA